MTSARFLGVVAQNAIASTFAPGALPFLIYMGMRHFDLTLPDQWSLSVFKLDAIISYATMLPGFWLLYFAMAKRILYVVAGVVLPAPLWLFIVAFMPADIRNFPLNPQFFVTPMVLLSGISAGLLFHALSAKNRRR